MRPKHIKTILVLLFVLCYRVAVASANPCAQQTTVTGIQKFDASPLQADDYDKITALLMQSQVCELETQLGPVKTITYGQVSLASPGTRVILPPTRFNIDTVTDRHSHWSRLLLFPWHGFW